MGKQQFHHFAIAISRSNPPRGPVRGPNFGPRGIGAAIQEQPGHSDVTECECHADDEVMRRVMADPKSADLGCGGVFTAVCTLHKRDLMIRLLQAGIRVPSPLTACRTYVY